MPEINTGYIKNAILCEDIREETGNKKSLMGVIAGDIMPESFPANIQTAIYLEYVPSGRGEFDELTLRLMQNDTEAASANIRVDNAAVVAVLKTPKSIIHFESECTLKLTAEINGAPAITVFEKKVAKGK